MKSMEFLFFIALVLYTIVIWSHKFKKRLKLWMIALFGVALATDTAATIVVCALANSIWIWNIHTITGLVSLFIMALHFIWAVGAKTLHGNTEEKNISTDIRLMHGFCGLLLSFQEFLLLVNASFYF